MTQQSLRQASFRAIHEGSGGTLNEDAMAAMAAELTAAEIDVPADLNSRMLVWLRLRLDREDGTLNELMTAFAVANDADGWASLGSFDPFGE